MHGAGNSFVLIEAPRGENKTGEDLRVLAQRLCARFGVDGLIAVQPEVPGADFGMLFYNADGSRGEMCGNGARCLARYGVERGLAKDPANIRIRAAADQFVVRYEQFKLDLKREALERSENSRFYGTIVAIFRVNDTLRDVIRRHVESIRQVKKWWRREKQDKQ